MKLTEIRMFMVLLIFTSVALALGIVSRSDALVAIIAITLIYVLTVLCRILEELKQINKRNDSK
jgi:VanZ family protein